MKHQILCVFAIIFCFSASLFAQSKPAWISALEDTITKKETSWKIADKIERGENGSYNYSYTLKSSKYESAIQIDKMNKIPNAEETFAGLVASFDDTMGKGIKKTKLENFGNEGFVWANLNKDGWTMIKFRKDDIFVDVYAPSEKTARRFAQYINELIPKN